MRSSTTAEPTLPPYASWGRRFAALVIDGFLLALPLILPIVLFAAVAAGDPESEDQNDALIIAVDPAAFGDPDAFTAAVDATLSTLKGLPSDDGVHYPGERSAAVAAGRAEEGIPVAPLPSVPRADS